MKIYTGIAVLPFGRFQVAVLAENEKDARNDFSTAVQQIMRIPLALCRPNDFRKSNKRIIAGMFPIKNCTSCTDGQWAWAKRI